MVRFWGACRSLGVDGNRRTGTAVSTVCLVGRLVVKTRMRTLLVVERDPFSDADLGFASGLERMQIDALVFQRPPQPLDHDVVHPPPLAVLSIAQTPLKGEPPGASGCSRRPCPRPGSDGRSSSLSAGTGRSCDRETACWCWVSGRSQKAPSSASAGRSACG